MEHGSSCLICGTAAPAFTEGGYCLACAGLLRWFRSYLADVRGLDLQSITHATRFVEDFGADSLDYVAWVIEAEATFDIHIPDRDAERIRTVGAFLARLRAEGAVWPDTCDIRIDRKWWGKRDWSAVDRSDGGGRDG